VGYGLQGAQQEREPREPLFLGCGLKQVGAGHDSRDGNRSSQHHLGASTSHSQHISHGGGDGGGGGVGWCRLLGLVAGAGWWWLFFPPFPPLLIEPHTGVREAHTQANRTQAACTPECCTQEQSCASLEACYEALKAPSN
jgi:hypothetical protein